MKSFKRVRVLLIVGLTFFISCGGNQNEPLVNRLKDEKATVQSEVKSTSTVKSFDKVESLIAELKDGSKYIRRNAAWELSKIKDKRAVIPLIAALRDEYEDVRFHAARALGEIGDNHAIEPLIAALKDKDDWVREEAAEALGKIGDNRAVKPLIEALKDKDDGVREKAAEALSKMKDRQVIDPLLVAFKKESENFQQMNLQEIKAKTTENIKIKNGINYIDLNGDNKKDMVVKGYRGNITAHSFSVYSFYVYKEHPNHNGQPWNIVARADSEDILKESYVTTTHEGADGILRDIRLIKLKGEEGYYLVIAERPIGEGYAAEEKVTFSFYKLFYERDESRFIYKKEKEIKTTDNYCDINGAFEKELGYK